MSTIPKEPPNFTDPCIITTSNSKTSIQDLPVEVLLKIFRYLDKNCLWHKVSLVCKAWNELAFNKSLWKRVCLTLSGKQNFLEKSSCFHHLFIRYYQTALALPEIFHLQDECIINDQMTRILARIPCIQHLSFENGLREYFFFRNFSSLTNLQSLSVHSPFTRDCFSPSLSDFIPINDNIQENTFNLRHLKQLNLNNVVLDKYFTEFLKKCPNLQDISLKLHHEVCSLSCIPLQKMLDTIFSIHSDTLESFQLHARFSTNLLGISQCWNLKKLNLENCHSFEDDLLFKISNFLNLVELKLKISYQFTSDAIDRMFEDGKLRNLITLELDSIYRLQNYNLKTISKNCPNLQVFLINDCQNVTDEGISFLVKKCSKITDFNVNDFYPNVYQHRPAFSVQINGSFLLDIRDNLCQLQRLNVSDRIYTSEYACSLRKARPDLDFNSGQQNILLATL